MRSSKCLPPVSASPGRVPITLAFKARHCGGSVSFAGAQSELQIPCSLGRTPAVVIILLLVGHLPRGVVLTIVHLHSAYCLSVLPSLYLSLWKHIPAFPVIFTDSCPVNCCNFAVPLCEARSLTPLYWPPRYFSGNNSNNK